MFQKPLFSLHLHSQREQGEHGDLTGSKYLREDALLVGAVDVVRGLPCLVGPVQQAAILGVPQQQLSQLAAPPPDGDMKGRVSFLEQQTENCYVLTKGNRSELIFYLTLFYNYFHMH